MSIEDAIAKYEAAEAKAEARRRHADWVQAVMTVDFHVRLPIDVANRLDEIAGERGISASDLIASFVRDNFSKSRRKR